MSGSDGHSTQTQHGWYFLCRAFVSYCTTANKSVVFRVLRHHSDGSMLAHLVLLPVCRREARDATVERTSRVVFKTSIPLQDKTTDVVYERYFRFERYNIHSFEPKICIFFKGFEKQN